MKRTPSDADTVDLTGYRVLVGVCGGIAAYKVCEVVSALAQRGAEVTVAMSRAARKFVGRTTFQALTGRRVLTSLWSADEASEIQHIALTDSAHVMLIAPATADVLGKIAAGVADDVVTTLVIGAASPVLLAPAMNERMWRNPIVQRNIAALKELGYHSVGPGDGWLACRSVGPGRMAEPQEIVDALVPLLTANSANRPKS